MKLSEELRCKMLRSSEVYSMIKPLSIILLFLFLLSACDGKKHSCTSMFCIKNIGTDTIHYAWNDGAYSDSIMPGEKKCRGAGNLDLEDGVPQNSHDVVFKSDHGDWTIVVDECEEVFEVE